MTEYQNLFAKMLCSKDYNIDGELFFDVFCKAFEADSLYPTVLSRLEFARNDGKKVFRGVGIENFDDYLKDITTGRFQRKYKHNNVFGEGLYFTDNPRVAKKYAGNLLTRLIKRNIITAKIKTTAEFADRRNILKEFSQKKVQLEHSLMKAFYPVLSENATIEFLNRLDGGKYYFFKSILLGYDGIFVHVTDWASYYVVYNRACLCILGQQKSFDRLTYKEVQNSNE